VRRDSNRNLLAGLVKALRPLGLATGEEGFNRDFHSTPVPAADAMTSQAAPRFRAA
jgi:hypothetical protein